MSKDNSGPAFPSQIRNDGKDSLSGFTHEEIPAGTTSNYGGMSLRDYFAAKAMQAAITGISNMSLEDAERACLRTSHLAYVIADAMLAERAK